MNEAEKDFVISTETTCDLDPEYYRKNNISLLGMIYTLENKDYDSALEGNISSHEFYEKVRRGAMPKTAQVSVDKAAQSFEKIVRQGYDVFHLSFSSALSGTFQSCTIAAEEIMKKYPGSKIRVVDSLSASMGQGLLLNYAVTLKKQGMQLDELADKIQEDRLHFCHNFTVDDLNHLHRGGRVSKMTAILGTALGIKPLLHVDNEGRLINVGKVRGRRQSLTWLVDKMEERVGSYKNDWVYISHGDCMEDAKFVADLVRKRFGIRKIFIGDIGPVIGTHSGPGTVALFFMGETRDI